MLRARSLALLFAAVIAWGLHETLATAQTRDRGIWVLDQVFYATPKDPNIVAEISETHSMLELIAVLKRHEIAFDRQNQRLETSLFPPDLYAEIAALPAGEPFIAPNGDESVASVIIARESGRDSSDTKPASGQTSGLRYE